MGVAYKLVDTLNLSEWNSSKLIAEAHIYWERGNFMKHGFVDKIREKRKPMKKRKKRKPKKVLKQLRKSTKVKMSDVSNRSNKLMTKGWTLYKKKETKQKS